MSDLSAQKPAGSSFLNPMMKSLLKSEDRSENCVTCAGVLGWTAFFLAMVVAGIALIFGLHAVCTPAYQTDSFSVSVPELIVFAASIVLTIVLSIVIAVKRRPSVALGVLCSVSYGVLLGFMPLLIANRRQLMLLALVLTLAIVAALLLVYRLRLVRVTQKFRSVMSVLFAAMVIGSLLMLLCSLIPGLNVVTALIRANPVVSILGSVIGIVIAAMFLLTDFYAIETAVEQKLPKEYEKMLGLSLAFSVIWLYFKVLQLLGKLKGRSR